MAVMVAMIYVMISPFQKYLYLHNALTLNTKFQTNQTMVWSRSQSNFQDAHHGSHIGCYDFIIFLIYMGLNNDLILYTQV